MFYFFPEHLAGAPEGHFLACNISDLLETVAWISWFANCMYAVCNFKLFLTLGCNFSFIDFAFVRVSTKE